jgi:CDP-4-dehydro-6-deoxyglucose reductase
MTTITARLISAEPLNTAVQQLLLNATGFRFDAGQYLHVHAGSRRLPLSIASAPTRLPELELHYRSTPGDEDAAALDALLPQARELTLEGPQGNVVVTEPTREPLTLIAGGIGVSQAASIIEQLADTGRQRRSVKLWWSLAVPDAKYPVAVVERVSQEAWFSHETLYDDPAAGTNAALARIRAGRIDPGRYILCGAPGFVYSCAEGLLARGVSRDALRSDVFDYAPRSDWAAPS